MLGKVITCFLDAPMCNNATGEIFFEALEVVLETRGIIWSNAVGLASDSVSVMVGKRNSVLSRVIQQQHEVFSGLHMPSCISSRGSMSEEASLLS